MDVEQHITRDDSSEDDDIVVKKKTVKRQIVDSDDEAAADSTQGGSESGLEEENVLYAEKPRKNRVLLNTDSDSENEEPTNRKVDIPKNVDEDQHKQTDCYELFRDKGDLYDADGSEDEGDGVSDNEQYSESKQSKGRNSLNEQKPERKSKTKAMSVMQQIHSETQRIVRESPVSLPYHRPRQRTLAEFLQRRKPMLANGTSARFSLNVSNEKLTEVWKQLEEREKEVEAFYKSESEDSEKECDTQENKESQDQPNCTADSGVHSPQSAKASPLEEQQEVNETMNCLQKEVTNIDISCDASAISDTAEKFEQMKKVSEKYEGSMQFSATVSQIPSMESREVVQKNTEDNIHVPAFSSENIESDFFGSKRINSNCAGLNGFELSVSNIATATNDVSSFYLENSETQFNLFSYSTKNSENEKTLLNNSENANEKKGLKKVDMHELANKGLESKTLEKADIDTELHAEMINASRSMGTQDFTLHWSETESMDMADIPPKSTAPLCTQTENKEISIANIAVSNEGTSTSNHASDAAHTKPAGGSYTQNFHLHYSESISWDNDNDGAKETRKCIMPPEADGENAMDISLDRKGNSHIKEANEMEVSKGTSKKDNTVSLQEDEKLNPEWWHNIEPPSDDSSDEEKHTENKKLLNIARNSFPGLGDITKLQPRLSDTPNGIIDLDEDVADKGGVVKFVQRFMKHSTAGVKKKSTRRTKELSVVSAEKNTEGLETVQIDVVTVLLGDDDPVEDPALAKPGAKLQRLKVELQQQMAQKRAEEWQKRQQEQKLDNEELDEGELSDCGAKENEIEEEMTDRETTDSEAEDEEEEDDVPLVEKKRIKSAFVDEEAEESEEDGTDEDESMDADDEMGKDEEEENATKRPDDKMDNEEETVSTNNDTIDNDAESSESILSKKPRLERIKTFDLFASQDDTTQEIQGEQDLELTSSLIPAYQPVRDGTATPWITKDDEPKKSVFELISPASDLTPLRSRSNLQSVSQTPLTVTSISSCDRTQQKPKRLFMDSEPISTQERMDELLDLCSGKFSHSAPDSRGGGIEQLMDPAEGSKEDLEKELLGLCSGKFTSIQHQDTQLIEPSPQLSSEKNSWKSLTVILSDEEDESESLVKIRPQRKGIHKKLAFSDDEEEAEEEVTEAEEPTDKDSVEGDTENDDEDDGEKIIEYDSEENEVVVAPEQKLSRKKMAEYFENEAELSESDWDSADEDERGLNRLEKEEGDDDQLDQEAVKEQLGKIHMRRVLDEDKREVRLLQEILFEDGELHSEGGGRERKFRWKNIDNIDENDLARRDTDDEGVDYDDEEDEAEWRRMRHEREVFLQKLKEKTERGKGEVLLEDEDSRLLKLGKAALKRIQRCNSQDMSEKPSSLCKTSSASQLSPDPKHPFKLLTKRGSFLARGESALARIAQMASESVNVVSRPKNTRNFVFAALSPEKEEDSSLVEKPVKAIKRCSSELVQPVVKRLKIFDENSRGKKLLDLLT